MERPCNINFLTEDENACMELLLQAQDIFDKICEESPQSPTDSYNFGHYLDAARSAILLRGARRMDSPNLLSKHRVGESTLDKDKKLYQSRIAGKADVSIDPPSSSTEIEKALGENPPYPTNPNPAVAAVIGVSPETQKSVTMAITQTIPNLLTNIYEKLASTSQSVDTIKEYKTYNP